MLQTKEPNSPVDLPSRLKSILWIIKSITENLPKRTLREKIHTKEKIRMHKVLYKQKEAGKSINT
jgi:hypothetical protein